MTRIPLHRIFSDWPVDHEHVLTLQRSMNADGQFEAITVWLEPKGQHFLVANGAHRYAAAKGLNWKDIEANILVCDEEAFWDARIMASRQHQKVSNERIVHWIIECWLASEWAKKDKTALEDIARTLWNIELESPERLPWEPTAGDALPNESRQLYHWFVTKGAKWGKSADDLRKVIFAYMGWPVHPAIDTAARAKKMTLEERNLLTPKEATGMADGLKDKKAKELSPEEQWAAVRRSVLSASDRVAELLRKQADTLRGMPDGDVLTLSHISHIAIVFEEIFGTDTESALGAITKANEELRQQVETLTRELELAQARADHNHAQIKLTAQRAQSAIAMPSAVIEEKTRP